MRAVTHEAKRRLTRTNTTPKRSSPTFARVVAQVGATSVVVGGISMGAAIALRYALRYPTDVRGLVLASFPPAGNSTRWALDLAAAIDRDGLEIAGEKFVWSDARFDPEAARWIRQGFLEHQAHALSAVLKRVLAIQPAVVDQKKSLALLEVPTLVIVGANDERSLEPSRDLARVHPGCTPRRRRRRGPHRESRKTRIIQRRFE